MSSNHSALESLINSSHITEQQCEDILTYIVTRTSIRINLCDEDGDLTEEGELLNNIKIRNLI